MSWNGWLNRRKAEQDAIVFEWLEAVVEGREEFYWHISGPVEWDTDLECWTVIASYEGTEIGVTFKGGERVFLVRGRGDVEEYAEIGKRISIERAGERYTLVFKD